MREFIDLISKLKNSKPVFKVALSAKANRIELLLIDKYRPDELGDDPLSMIVREHFYEDWQSEYGRYKTDTDRIYQKCKSDVKAAIKEFALYNSEMKNPAQTKLYKWLYRNQPDHGEYNETLLLIYKYLRTFCGSDMRGDTQVNKRNGIALLEALMEKYGPNR